MVKKETIKLKTFTRPTHWDKEKIGEIYRDDTGQKICICTPWEGWVSVARNTCINGDNYNDTLLRLVDVVFNRNKCDYYVDLEFDEEGYENFYHDPEGKGFPAGFVLGQHQTTFDAFVKIGLPYSVKGEDKKPYDPEEFKHLNQYGEF